MHVERGILAPTNSQPYLGQDILVKVGLHGTHFYMQDLLALHRQRRKDFLLQLPEHQRLELLMELLDLHLMVGITSVKSNSFVSATIRKRSSTFIHEHEKREKMTNISRA